ncbi:MAG: hypothetical protein H0U44_08085 [Flavisolibacter sp.]|nr:hypothetical protein [Flavisolibacter sp.]
MRIIYLLAAAMMFFTSCNNSGSGQTFCDTTCRKDSFHFRANNQLNSIVSIGVKDCIADTLMWTHNRMDFSNQMAMKDLAKQDVRLNEQFISCVIQDTVQAWLTFNDCVSGRGFLFKLPFGKKSGISQITGAINDFDPKFSVEEKLRAYTDRGSIFVINIETGAQEMMTFKEQYDIDFNKIHEVVDSVNITSKRIYVKLLNGGKEVPLEKNINL